MADIPGIIEGASEEQRVGNSILRHIERNSTFIIYGELPKRQYL